MITRALYSLGKKKGSSSTAIARVIRQQYDYSPKNFRKSLLRHLKRLVAAGKIVRMKNSFKLPG